MKMLAENNDRCLYKSCVYYPPSNDNYAFYSEKIIEYLDFVLISYIIEHKNYDFAVIIGGPLQTYKKPTLITKYNAFEFYNIFL